MVAAEIVDAVAALEKQSYCFCGQLKSAHKYWEDRIYDVNGYLCPSRVGGEYRFDVTLTEREWRRRKIDAVQQILTAYLSVKAVS